MIVLGLLMSEKYESPFITKQNILWPSGGLEPESISELCQMSNSRIPFLSVDATDINEPSLVKIQNEINENAESRVRCLEIFRKELKNLKDIEPYMEEEFLLRFLRVSKFDTLKAVQRLQKYYLQQDTLIDAFKGCAFSYQKLRHINHLWTSPYRLQNNSFLLISLAGVDYKNFTFAERFYVEILAFNKLLENPLNQICGVTFIYDYEGFNLRSMLAYSPGWVQCFLAALMNVPCRLKAFHIVNTSSIFSSVYKMVYPLIPKKLQDRVFIHPNNDNWLSLHNLVPADILPEEYGGKLKHENMINCLQNLEDLDERFLKTVKFGCKKTKHYRKSLRFLY